MKKAMFRNARILLLVLTSVIGICNGVCPVTGGWISRGTHCFRKVGASDRISSIGSYCSDPSVNLPITDEDVSRMVMEDLNINTWHWTSGRYFNDSSTPTGWRWDTMVRLKDTFVHYGQFRAFTDYQTSIINYNKGTCLKAFIGNNMTTEDCMVNLPIICSYMHSIEVCPTGFDSSGSRCLSTGQYEHTHDEARAICKNRFGVLYEPRTTADLDDLYRFTSLHNWHMNHLRVGVVYKNNAWRFESDGTQVPHDLWSDNYPPNHMDKVCGLYNATTRRLVNVRCDDMYHYICIDKPRTHCPPGYTSFEWSSACVLAGPKTMDFLSSSSFCKQWGGEIATIRNVYIHDYMKIFSINSFLPYVGKNFWIDANQWTVLGKLQYPDGTKVRFNILARYDATPNSGCYYMKSDFALTYTMCNSSTVYPFCMAKQGNCPLGFLKRGLDCFYFNDGSKGGYTQVLASGSCKSFSADLVWTRNRTVLIDELSLKVYDAASSYKVDKYWIGGVRKAGLWSFPDLDVNYTADSLELQDLWTPGKPDAAGGDCLVMNYTGLLSNVPCTESNKFFLCQATEGLHGMKVLDEIVEDLPILNQTCYEEDIYNPQFRSKWMVYSYYCTLF